MLTEYLVGGTEVVSFTVRALNETIATRGAHSTVRFKCSRPADFETANLALSVIREET
jgi:hypothetical protein